jgi:hypothetical protein
MAGAAEEFMHNAELQRTVLGIAPEDAVALHEPAPEAGEPTTE